MVQHFATHDLDYTERSFNLEIAGVRIVITAPGPLPDPYVGDDLRKSRLALSIERPGGADFEATLPLTRAELAALSLASRQALMHMAGRLK